MAKKNNVIVDVDKLTKAYDGVNVVDGISFDVEKGEIFGILGPNGAGKTTTLEMIETIRPIDSGAVHLDGIDVSKKPNDVKAIIGVQLQSSAFFDHLTLSELLVMYGSLYKQTVDPEELLGKVNLTKKSKSMANQLSGGQKQRFSIAVSLVNKPKVIFLDEPTTGLDPQARRNLWELIQQIKKDGITVVLTTHYMDEAEILCDRLAIMDEGKIIAMDTPQKLIEKLLDSGFKKKQVVQQANLEDVFIDLTGHDIRDE